jgi:hypothetical protein
MTVSAGDVVCDSGVIDLVPCECDGHGDMEACKAHQKCDNGEYD